MRVPYYIHPGVDVERPIRMSALDAGTDFYVPRTKDMIIMNPGTNLEMTMTAPCTLKPGSNAKIRSGISIEVDLGQMALMCNRSGIASNQNVLVGADVVDSTYDGEIHFDIHNVGQFPIKILPDSRITQVVMVPIICAQFDEYPAERLYEHMSSIRGRGNRGFGSTGTGKNDTKSSSKIWSYFRRIAI